MCGKIISWKDTLAVQTAKTPPLKLQSYGGIEMCVLLLLLFFFFALRCKEPKGYYYYYY